MNTSERLVDIEKLSKEPNTALLWYKHGNWLIEQVKKLEEITNKPENDELETFEDYIDHMIKEGYWAEEDLAPLKCHHCGSKNLEDRHWSYENIGVVEYDRWCNDCDKLVNIWSYGSWNL